MIRKASQLTKTTLKERMKKKKKEKKEKKEKKTKSRRFQGTFVR